jgi:hypothetical protein
MKGAKKQSGRYRVAGMAKLVTRDLAALSFLQTIPMVRQEERLREAMTRRTDDDEDGFSHSDESEEERREAAAAAASSWWRVILSWVGWVLGYCVGRQRLGRLVGSYQPKGSTGNNANRGGNGDDDYDDDDDDDLLGYGHHDVWERADPTMTAAQRRQRRLQRQQLQRTIQTNANFTNQPLELPAGMVALHGGGNGLAASSDVLSSTGRKLEGPIPTTVRPSLGKHWRTHRSIFDPSHPSFLLHL